MQPPDPTTAKLSQMARRRNEPLKRPSRRHTTKIKAVALLCALSLLARPALCATDLCNGLTINHWAPYVNNQIDPCIFDHNGWWYDNSLAEPAVPYTCSPTNNYDYIYLDFGVTQTIQTLVVLSDYRNTGSSFSGTATLPYWQVYVGGSADIPTSVGQDIAGSSWVSGSTDMSQTINVGQSGSVMFLRYVCPSAPCYQWRFYQIACFTETTASISAFTAGSLGSPSHEILGTFCQHTSLCSINTPMTDPVMTYTVASQSDRLIGVNGMVMVPSMHSGNTSPTFESSGVQFKNLDWTTGTQIGTTSATLPPTNVLWTMSFASGAQTIESFSITYTDYVAPTSLQGFFFLQGPQCADTAACMTSQCITVFDSNFSTPADRIIPFTVNYAVNYQHNLVINYPTGCHGAYTYTTDFSADTQSLSSLSVSQPTTSSMEALFTVYDTGSVTYAQSAAFDLIFTLTHVTSGEAYYTFTLQITYVNPCDTTDFINSSGGIIGDGAEASAPVFTMYPGMQIGITASSDLRDYGSASYGPTDGWSLCLPFRVISVTDPQPFFSSVALSSSYNSVDSFLSVTLDPATRLSGTYSVEINASFNAFGVQRAAGTYIVNLQLQGCEFVDGTQSGTTVFPYTLQTRQALFTLVSEGVSLSSVNTCSTTFDYSYTWLDASDNAISQPSGTTLVPVAGSQHKIEITPLLSQAGLVYKSVETVTIYYNEGTFAGSWVTERIITIVDECADAAVSGIGTFTVSDMETSVLRPVTQANNDLFWYFPDDNYPMLHYGTANWDVNICGKMLVDVIHDGVTTEFVSLVYDYQVLVLPNTYYLQLNPTLRTHEGTFTINLRVYFQEYAAIDPVDVPVVIDILPCQIIQQQLNDPAVSPTFAYTTTIFSAGYNVDAHSHYHLYPACDTLYTVNYAVSVSPTPNSPVASQDLTSPMVAMQTSDLLNAMVFTVTSTLLVTDYAAASGPSSFATVITIEFIDPCLTSAMVPPFTQENVYAIVGSGQSKTFEFLTFPDELSLTNDEDGSGQVSCLTRLTSITEITNGVIVPEPTYLTLEMGPQLSSISYIANDNSLAGVHNIEVKSWLEFYPSQLATATLVVTFYENVTSLQIDDCIHVLGDAQLEIQLPIPQFNPPLHQSLNLETGENGAILRYEILLKESNRWIEFPLDLGTYEDSTKRLIVDPSDTGYVGRHEVKVIYHGQDYLSDQTLFSKFDLVVLPEASEINIYYLTPKPFFELPDADALLNEIYAGEGWLWEIPKAIHPTGLETKMNKVELGRAATFVKYDAQAQELYVLEGTTSNANAGTYPIILQLIDSDGTVGPPLTIVLSVYAIEEASQDDETTDGVAAVGAKYAALLAQRNERRKRTQERNSLNGISEETKEPKASFVSMDSYGNIQISFSKPMVVIPEVSRMSSSGIKLAKASDTTTTEEDTSSADGRMLEAAKDVNVKLDIIKVKVLPGDFSDENDLKFSWKVTKYTPKALELKVKFAKVVSVSANSDPDEIEISLTSQEFFFDEDGMSLSVDTKLTKRIPIQYDDPGFKEALEQTEKAMKRSTQTVLAANLVLNILMSASLQYLWEMINAQQIVVLLPLCNIQLPDNAAIIFNALMTVAAVEAIPTDTIYNKVFNASPTGRAINHNFEQVGFEHHLLMNNFGSLGFIFFVIGPSIYVSYYIGLCFSCRCCKRYTGYLQEKLFYNTLLRLIIESYVIGLICIFLNARDLEFYSGDKWVTGNAFMTVIFLPLFLLFPIVALRFMYYRQDKMQQKQSVDGRKFYNRYGELFAGYETKEAKMLFFWFAEYLRKIMLASVMVFTQTQLWLQLMVIYNTSIFLIIASGFIKVRTTRYGDRMDKFNEIKIIIIVYHLMLFTMLVPEPETKFKIGYSCALVVVLGTIINMHELVASSYRLVTRRCRLNWHKRRARIAMLDRSKRPSTSNLRKIRQLREMYDKQQAELLKAKVNTLIELGFDRETATEEAKKLFPSVTSAEQAKILRNLSKNKNIGNSINKIIPSLEKKPIQGETDEDGEDSVDIAKKVGKDKRKKFMLIKDSHDADALGVNAIRKTGNTQEQMIAMDPTTKLTKQSLQPKKQTSSSQLISENVGVQLTQEELDYMFSIGISVTDLNNIKAAKTAEQESDNYTSIVNDYKSLSSNVQEEVKHEIVDSGFGAYYAQPQHQLPVEEKKVPLAEANLDIILGKTLDRPASQELLAPSFVGARNDAPSQLLDFSRPAVKSNIQKWASNSTGLAMRSKPAQQDNFLRKSTFSSLQQPDITDEHMAYKMPETTPSYAQANNISGHAAMTQDYNQVETMYGLNDYILNGTQHSFVNPRQQAVSRGPSLVNRGDRTNNSASIVQKLWKGTQSRHSHN